LDFFTEKQFDGDRIADLIKQHEETLGYQAVSVADDFGFYTFYFRYKDNTRFKVDFNRYSFMRFKKGFQWHGLTIDSLYDIGVNKIQAIRTHPRERDYIDMYFILKKTNWQIKKLLTDADRKFRSTSDVLQVVKNFLKAAEVVEFPAIFVPFDRKAMYRFYEDLARELKPKILK